MMNSSEIIKLNMLKIIKIFIFDQCAKDSTRISSLYAVPVPVGLPVHTGHRRVNNVNNSAELLYDRTIVLIN